MDADLEEALQGLNVTTIQWETHDPESRHRPQFKIMRLVDCIACDGGPFGTVFVYYDIVRDRAWARRK